MARSKSEKINTDGWRLDPCFKLHNMHCGIMFAIPSEPQRKPFARVGVIGTLCPSVSLTVFPVNFPDPVGYTFPSLMAQSAHLQ
jgi:hypothetical protein